MLFGERTEKLEKLIKDHQTTSSTSTDKNDQNKPKGNGRTPAAEYTGAEKVDIPHTSLQHKSSCPEFKKGKLYRMKMPATVVRVTGKAPLQATVYQRQRLRCNLCGKIFTVKTPEGIGEKKYDAASAAMIALLKYGSGLPFNRLQQLQASVGIPLAASTQWAIVDDAANKVLPARQQSVLSGWQRLPACSIKNLSYTRPLKARNPSIWVLKPLTEPTYSFVKRISLNWVKHFIIC